MNDVMDEVKWVDLSDTELKHLIGSLFENIKGLEENKRKDEELVEIRQILKKKEDERYNERLKWYKKQLKAARHVAKLRGISFKLPEGVGCDR